MDLPELKNVTMLDLSWNRLRQYASLINHLRKKTPCLESLSLDWNAITYDDAILVHALTKLTQLSIFNGKRITSENRAAAQKLILSSEMVQRLGRSGEMNSYADLANAARFLRDFGHPENIGTKITSLCIDELGLVNISMLRNLANLKFLSARDNKISDVSVLLSCTKLRQIDLGNNEISSINKILNNLPFIQDLDISFNSVEDINVESTLQALKSINASGNRLTSIKSFRNLTNVIEIYLSHNKLGDANELAHLKICEKLEVLDIEGNPLSSKEDCNLFILFHLQQLKSLNGLPVRLKDIARASDIFGGRLTNDFLIEKFGYINGQATVNLKEIDDLDLQECEIRSVHLDVSQLISLTSLNLIGNELVHFSGLVELKLLKTLCLSKNNIESVFPLTKQQRNQMTRSQYSQAGQSKADSYLIKETESIMPSLEVLHLGSNKIKDMTLLQLHRFPSLRSLFLESNDIMKVDGLDGCSNLRHLVLDKNRIKNIDQTSFQSMWRLEELHMDSNRVSDLNHLRALVNLKRLYLGVNRIAEVEEITKLRPLTHLKEISMIGNGVSRRMLHRPCLIWHVPSIENIDGIKVSREERFNAESYFMEQGHERAYHIFDQQVDVSFSNSKTSGSSHIMYKGDKITPSESFFKK